MCSAVDLEAISTSELVDTVHRALGVLAARSAPESGLAAMELGERLASALDLGEAALAALVQTADREGAPSAWRYAGTRGWLKSACGMRTGRAAERVTVARQLPRLPRVAASLEAGKLSYGYASTICDAVAQLSDADCAKAERILLEAVADGLSATKVAKLGARIKDVIDERDGTDSPGEDCERGTRSWWRVSRSLGGGGAVKGWFDPELLALVNDRLGPLARPAGPGDDRDHAQRMADALGSVLAGGGSNWQATLVIKLTDPSAAQPPGADRVDEDGSGGREPFTGGVGVVARGTGDSPGQNIGVGLADGDGSGGGEPPAVGVRNEARGVGRVDDDGSGGRKPSTGGVGAVERGTGRSPYDRPGMDRPGMDRPGMDRPGMDRPGMDRPGMDRPGMDRARGDRPGGDRVGRGRGVGRAGVGRIRGDRRGVGRAGDDRRDGEPPTSGVGGAACGTDHGPSQNAGGHRQRGTTAGACTTCDCSGAGQRAGGPVAAGRVAGDGRAAAESGSEGRLPAWPLEDARVSARLADGTPVEPWQARILALNAGVSALVLGQDGIPLYLGRRSRFVSRHQRQVLEALYETCAADECDIPARLCQLDHVFNWADDGTTDIDLLAPACAFHNRLKYQRPDWVTSTRDQHGLWRYRVRRPRPRWGGSGCGQARGP